MVHTKKRLESLDKGQLVAMLLFLLALVKRTNKRAYKKAEHLGGLNPEHRFKSWIAYRKYQAFLHIHNVPHHHHRFVIIAGRRHKVACDHCRKEGKLVRRGK